MASLPAYRITTERTVIRCWAPADAAALKDAVDTSLEHLKPFLPWAEREPTPLEDKILRLRKLRAAFDSDQGYTYGIFDRDERRVLGATQFVRSGPQGLEIGYWLRVDAVGSGLATECVGAMTRVGFAIHKARRMEIQCAVSNPKSAGVPRRLGFVHEATLREREAVAGGALVDRQTWSLFADAYPTSPAAHVATKAFDATGVPLL